MAKSITVSENCLVALGQLGARTARLLELSQGPLTEAIRGLFSKRFSTEGRYGGRGWPPSRPATLHEKLMRGFGSANMVRTGTLLSSLTEEGSLGLTRRGKASSRTFGYSRLSPDKQSLYVGSWDPVIRLVTGRRPILPDDIPRQDAEAWTELAAEQLGLG